MQAREVRDRLEAEGLTVTAARLKCKPLQMFVVTSPTVAKLNMNVTESKVNAAGFDLLYGGGTLIEIQARPRTPDPYGPWHEATRAQFAPRYEGP